MLRLTIRDIAVSQSVGTKVPFCPISGSVSRSGAALTCQPNRSYRIKSPPVDPVTDAATDPDDPPIVEHSNGDGLDIAVSTAAELTQRSTAFGVTPSAK